MMAAWEGKTNVVMELVKAGINLNMRNEVSTHSAWMYTFKITGYFTDVPNFYRLHRKETQQ